MKYCTIEGGSYYGKTTTINLLSQQGIHTFGEVEPSQPKSGGPSSIDKYAAEIDVYIRAEERRSERIRQLPPDTDLVIADRSIFSTITYQDLQAEFGADRQKGRIEARRRAREYAVEQIDAAVTTGRILVPNCMVVMFVPDRQEFTDRVLERGSINSPIALFEGSSFWAEQIFASGNQVLGNKSVVPYSVPTASLLNKRLSATQIASDVLSVIRNLHTTNNPRPVRTLQRQ